ncbi:hypothetical protein RM530_13570 [Algiphilus sp. W345]|uniref:Entericidin n=1 Tax=Banduia mediterranea TaxID=3075609 RepID=A0ABU2WKG8_9GAMM|nr:hypothetical protein [Algiphilus sp. W345]MDT0498383.1 hypothetical protein [Algiphilus sp. W345]
MKTIMAASGMILMLSSGLWLSACNTIQGAGEDLEAGAETVQECANEDGDGCDK